MTEVMLSNKIIDDATECAALYSRSVQNQIEHWVRVGKLAEENPDMPYIFIQEVLQGKDEVEAGDVSPFKFRED